MALPGDTEEWPVAGDTKEWPCLKTLRNGLCLETLRKSTKTSVIVSAPVKFDQGPCLIHVRNVTTWTDLLDVVFIKFLEVHS